MMAGVLQSQEGPVTLRVMSYNIWYDNPGNEGNAWTDRAPGVLRTLQKLDPDILCVQEALFHQILDLQQAGYSYYGVGRDDGHDKGEHSAILYRNNHFEILDGGTFWLSEDPDSAGSVGWDAVLPRIVTWVKLKELDKGHSFYVFNTHLSHVGEAARMNSVQLILERIAYHAGEYPVLLTGDFNFKRDSRPYVHISDSREPIALDDARDRVGQDRDDPGYSFVGQDFTGDPGHIIDHIFISENVEVTRAGIHSNCEKGRCPSDHLPVVVDVWFK